MIKEKLAFSFLPREFDPHWKINITDDGGNGTTTDVSKRVRLGEFNKVIFREGLGVFKLKLVNVDAVYSGVWSDGDVVEFYADLTDGSTKKYKGIIDDIKEVRTDRGNFLEITGRHDAYLLGEDWVIKTFEEKTADEMVKALINDFNSGKASTIQFTYTNVDFFTDIDDITRTNRNLLGFFGDISVLADADGYPDDDRDIHLFAENSILNSDEAVVEKYNLLSIRFGKDKYYEKTKLTVYGMDEAGQEIIDTVGSGDRSMVPIINRSLKTYEEVHAFGLAALAQATDVPEEGTVLSRGIPTLEPGENFWISIPRSQIHGIYKAIRVKHLVGTEVRSRWNTEVRIERPQKGIEHQLSERAKKEFDIIKIDNPNNMEFSYNFTFKDDTNIEHDNTATLNGYLYPTAASGIMTSHTKTASSNISYIELKYRGENLEGTTFDISVDGGTNWQTGISKDTLTAAAYVGLSLKVRVNFSALTTTKIYSLRVLYK